MTLRRLRANYPKLAALVDELTNVPLEQRVEDDPVCVRFQWSATPQGTAFWAEVDNEINLQEKEDAIEEVAVDQKFED